MTWRALSISPYQPVKAKWGGQGLAKPSAFINIAAPDFREILYQMYDEHVDGGVQGLTLVHLSAQPEPFLSLKSTESTKRVPLKVLTSSQKVDACKPPVGSTKRSLYSSTYARLRDQCHLFQGHRDLS